MNNSFFQKPAWYFLFASVCYASLIFFTIFFRLQEDIITNVMFSAFIALSGFVNFIFVRINFEKLYAYKTKNKIIGIIIIFIFLDLFGHIVKSHILNGAILSLLLGYCSLLFSAMFILVSGFFKNKSYHIVRIMYGVGRYILVVGNIMAIINLYFPFV